MKVKFILLFFILSSNLLLAQKPASRMFYLDSLWNETEEVNFKYYRIIKDYYADQPLHEVLDYYENDTLQMRGSTSSVDRIIKEGLFVFYYKNGKRKTVANYQENKLTGKEFEWYENGNKKSVGEYILSSDKFEPSILVLNQYWDKEGQQKVIDGNGDYEESDDSFFAAGKVSNGLKTGEWKGEDKKSKLQFIENYNNGILVSGISTDSINVPHHYEKIYTKPRPRKGIEHFYKYIGKNFNFTKQTEGRYGKVVLLFYIEKDGKASDFKVLRTADPDLDEEAIRLISNYPEWESGTYRGIKSRFSFTIPISIQSPQ
ncbi:energy transducer TonB [Flavobacterium paronense]|uniref:Energy transducer TonB n=1 Tax=Flavobacterium paronense TaxID=1392775 RepID=A0ABV5GDR3_9FLAO|nr:energy transducer TonB [Flavobacterium paronense]MDN3678059.1 energy transducer TonB [Flavobacterium paronense]